MKRPKLNRLGIILKEKGRSNRWLADKLGFHENTVSNWTSNTAQPHLNVFYDISLLLECDLRELIISTKKK